MSEYGFCIENGHEFVVTGIYCFSHDKIAFKCKNCEYTKRRPLTKKEMKAVNLLGINNVSWEPAKRPARLRGTEYGKES